MSYYNKFMAILALFCGFLCGSVQAADAPKSYNNPDKSITVSAQEPEFTIRLASNPTTGYSWFIKRYPKTLLELKSHRFIPPTQQIVGAGGTEIWVFKAKSDAFTAPQIMKIKLIYARPWEVKEDSKETEFTIVSHE